MGSQRHKLARGLGDFVPVSINFSQLEKDFEENESEFEPSDNGAQEDKMMDNLVYEEAVVNILCNFEPREQLIFVFQLLRDGGYQLDHASLAKVVNLSRRQYMRILEDVRLKSWLYIQGYKARSRHKESHKGV
jgi:hypothetical protein